jgi:hypothetical protein
MRSGSLRAGRVGAAAAASQLPADAGLAFRLLDLLADAAFERRAGMAPASERQHGPVRAVFQQQGQRAVQ